MSLSYNRWKKLFLFCLGLSVAAAFCMKWMESDFWAIGEKFTIIGLELFYTREKVMTVLAGLDGHVSTILKYHLHFDFAFMAGIYPGIAALCMILRERAKIKTLKKLLYVLAAAQTLAWACDITENVYLLKWIKEPAIGDEFGLYHFIVAAKWIIALTAVLFSVAILLLGRKLKAE